MFPWTMKRLPCLHLSGPAMLAAAAAPCRLFPGSARERGRCSLHLPAGSSVTLPCGDTSYGSYRPTADCRRLRPGLQLQPVAVRARCWWRPDGDGGDQQRTGDVSCCSGDRLGASVSRACISRLTKLRPYELKCVTRTTANVGELA